MDRKLPRMRAVKAVVSFFSASEVGSREKEEFGRKTNLEKQE